ncbi:ent-kaurene synthase-like protein 1 [Hordeum vulgare]|nr:ent-kaurene synthase-like protein 1 [Hordeum vulgare]
MSEGMLHIRDVEGPKKTRSMETRLEAMEQQVFKCQGMVEHGLNANHMMITEFTSNHNMDAIDIGKHLSRLYDRVDLLQGQIYDLQNQNCSLQDPCFPQCVEWILQNQHGNGYWGSSEFDSSASRDVLLSTLACVIALKKWNVGPEEIMREYALKIPFYATVDLLDHKWSIEHFGAIDSHMMKTKYMSCGVNKDILALAVEDFCISQSIYQREVEHLDSWEKECRLGKLQFAQVLILILFILLRLLMLVESCA